MGKRKNTGQPSLAETVEATLGAIESRQGDAKAKKRVKNARRRARKKAITTPTTTRKSGCAVSLEMKVAIKEIRLSKSMIDTMVANLGESLGLLIERTRRDADELRLYQIFLVTGLRETFLANQHFLRNTLRDICRGIPNLHPSATVDLALAEEESLEDVLEILRMAHKELKRNQQTLNDIEQETSEGPVKECVPSKAPVARGALPMASPGQVKVVQDAYLPDDTNDGHQPEVAQAVDEPKVKHETNQLKLETLRGIDHEN